MNVRVYVVCKGEYGEGHDPVSVHSSYIGAHQHAKTFGAREMERVAEDRWRWCGNGCDEVWIYRLPVDMAEAPATVAGER